MYHKISSFFPKNQDANASVNQGLMLEVKEEVLHIYSKFSFSEKRVWN